MTLDTGTPTEQSTNQDDLLEIKPIREAVREKRRERKIDFNAEPMDDLDIQFVQLKEDDSEGEFEPSEEQQKLLNFMNSQVNSIASILKLPKDEVQKYYFLISDLGPKRSGQHSATSIRIDSKIFNQAVYQTHYESRVEAPSLGVDPKMDSAGAVLKITRKIAHELYHARQRINFPEYYRNHVENNYIQPEADAAGYAAQIAERGPRAFEDKYINFLLENPDKIEDAEYREMARYYKGKMDTAEPQNTPKLRELSDHDRLRIAAKHPDLLKAISDVDQFSKS